MTDLQPVPAAAASAAVVLDVTGSDIPGEAIALRGRGLLISHRDNDDRLTEQELLHTLLLVISAGYETTVNLLDQVIHQLLTHPELLVQLRAGAFTWPQLTEETLR